MAVANGRRQSARAAAKAALVGPTEGTSNGRKTENEVFIEDELKKVAQVVPGGASFPAAVTEATLIKNIKNKNDQKTARSGQFAWTGTHFNGQKLTKEEIENAYRLAHWNASHEAAASGLIAEGPAVVAGIKQYLNLTGPTARKGAYTEIYQGKGVRVDVVDCFHMKGRTDGINPLSFIFEEVVPTSVMPWEVALQTNGRWGFKNAGNAMTMANIRQANATYFQKGRVDWNLLKLWCGAGDTIDTRHSKVATVPEGVVLTDARGKARTAANGRTPLTGKLSNTNIAKLQTGLITGLGLGGDPGRNAALKRLLRFIFVNERGLFKLDCKGALDGEGDETIMVWEAGSLVKKHGESKISDGPSEAYPGEAIQILKANVLDCLYYQCNYGDVKLNFVKRIDNFFAAYGIGAFGSVLRFTSLFKGAGGVSDPNRSAKLRDLATLARAVWPNGGGSGAVNNKNSWPVALLGLPTRNGGTAMHTVNNVKGREYFPYCNYSAIWAFINQQRGETEGRLAAQLGSWGTARQAKLLADPITSDAALFFVYAADALKGGNKPKKLSTARELLFNLNNQLRLYLSKLANGMTVDGIKEVCRLGGAEVGFPAIPNNNGINRPINSIGLNGIYKPNKATGKRYYTFQFRAQPVVGQPSRNTIKRSEVGALDAAAEFFQAAEVLLAFMFIQVKNLSDAGVGNNASRAVANQVAKNEIDTINRIYTEKFRKFAGYFVLGCKMYKSNPALINSPYVPRGGNGAKPLNNGRGGALLRRPQNAGNTSLMTGAAAAQEEARRLGAALLGAGVPVNGSNEEMNFSLMGPLNFPQEGMGEAPNATARVNEAARPRAWRSPSPGARRERSRSRNR